MIETKLLNLHTAYLAKVVSVKGNYAKIQPLGKVKAYDGVTKIQAPLSNVPIISSARNKLIVTENAISEIKPIAAGDIVICVCCERDITEALKGKNDVPPVGHHSKSDSIIVGIL